MEISGLDIGLLAIAAVILAINQALKDAPKVRAAVPKWLIWLKSPIWNYVPVALVVVAAIVFIFENHTAPAKVASAPPSPKPQIKYVPTQDPQQAAKIQALQDQVNKLLALNASKPTPPLAKESLPRRDISATAATPSVPPSVSADALSDFLDSASAIQADFVKNNDPQAITKAAAAWEANVKTYLSKNLGRSYASQFDQAHYMGSSYLNYHNVEGDAVYADLDTKKQVLSDFMTELRRAASVINVPVSGSGNAVSFGQQGGTTAGTIIQDGTLEHPYDNASKCPAGYSIFDTFEISHGASKGISIPAGMKACWININSHDNAGTNFEVRDPKNP